MKNQFSFTHSLVFAETPLTSLVPEQTAMPVFEVSHSQSHGVVIPLYATRQTETQLQKKLAETLIMAQEKERTKLGHELHDNVNQLLATARLFLTMITKKESGSDELISKANQYIESAYNEIRTLSRGLVMPKFSQQGLIDSFRNILEDIAISGIFEISFDYDEEIEAQNDTVKITLLRILQEQIKNTVNYSKASFVEVSLTMKNDKACLLIKDNGVGFDAGKTGRGIGLGSILERTELLNGKMELNTSPGKGCELKITLPV